MRRVSRWAFCAPRAHLGIVGMLVALLSIFGWAQSGGGAPMVVFLEPSEGSTISTDIDAIQIRFRLISPDNTNLMRYQPFINGFPGNEPIPIDPPSPQVELAILWRGVKQFPDGVHIITIKVVDAKGREGLGSLTLYKGRDYDKPKAEILTPKSGDVVRGEVPILVRVSDDRGVKAIAVSATQKETSKTFTIYLAAGNYGRFMEIRVSWNTAEKHPTTKEDLFPDGVYLLQAKVRDFEDNEGISNEVLVIVQNRVAQPVISQIGLGQTMRGGATPPIVPEPQPKSTLEVPNKSTVAQTSLLFSPQKIETQGQPLVSLPTTQSILMVSEGQTKVLSIDFNLSPFEVQRQMQVAVATPVLQPRLTLALPAPETARQEAKVEVYVQRGDLPSPRISGAVTTSRSNLSVPRGQSIFAETPIKPQLIPSVSDSPQVAFPVGTPISAPAGQIKLVSTRILPAPSTLRRAPEVPEIPAIAPPISMPRLPEPEIKTQKPKSYSLMRPSVLMQPAHSFRYTVIAGDTIYSLAEKFGVSVKELAEANGLSENSPLRIGQRLIIPARPVAVLVDGKIAQCEVPAFIRDGIAVGSFRAVIEAAGGVVGWNNEKKQATAILGSINIVANIGEKTLNVNGETVPLSIAPFLLRNRTFLPLRELGTSMGKDVKWQKGTLMMETARR